MTKLCWYLPCLGLFLFGNGPAPGHDPIRNKTPHDLDLLPRNTISVVHVRSGDLWKRLGPLGVTDRLAQADIQRDEHAERVWGFPLTAVERVTIVATNEERPLPQFMPLFIQQLNRPLDQAKVRQALLKPSPVFQTVGGMLPAGPGEKVPPAPPPPPPPPKAEVKEKQIKGRTMLVLEEPNGSRALCFLSERMFVFGDPAGIQAALEAAEEPDTSAFAVECRKLAQQNSFLCAFHFDRFPREWRQNMSRNIPLASVVLEAQTGFLTVAANKGVEVTAVATFAEETTASSGRKAVSDSLTLLRAVLPMALQELAHTMVEDPDAPAHSYALLKSLGADLQQAQIELTGTTVKASLRHTCDDRFLAGLVGDLLPLITELGPRPTATTFRTVGGMLPAGGGRVAPVPDPPVRPEKAESMRKIAKAFEKYREAQGHYPPPALYGKDGTPLLSWRVLLLPYLGEQKLYEQFKLDEPWYSKHNRPLLGKMPRVYGSMFQLQTAEPLVGRTDFRMILGPGAAYEGKEGIQPKDLTDGAGQTLLVVENVRFGGEVAWTRPEGYRFGTEWPLPRLVYGAGGHEQGFYALFGDGQVRFVKDTVSSTTFRAMITRNGGEKLSEEVLGKIVK
jgi:hypothetical protein